MFNELYILTGKGEVCDRSLQSIALTNILQMQDFTYQEIFSRLPEKQKEVLIAIGKEQKATGVTSGKFIKIQAKYSEFRTSCTQGITGKESSLAGTKSV